MKPPLSADSLSQDTLWLVDRFFKPADRADAVRMLEKQCGRTLPSCENADARALERLRFAAIKLSGGRLDGLSHAMREAMMDWRDLLMAADFGLDETAHRLWFDSLRAGGSPGRNRAAGTRPQGA